MGYLFLVWALNLTQRQIMKKGVAIVCLVFVATACANEGSDTDRKLDSLELKIDTTLDKAADSIKAKALDLKEKIKEEWNDAKDSSHKKDTVTY